MAPLLAPTVPKRAAQVLPPCPTPCPTSDDASTLELVLVTLALVTSAVLALIPSTRDHLRNDAARPSFFITVFSIFFALAALAISGVTLGLGWGRTISIDALATVVFALIPALLSMPLGNIEYAWYRAQMAGYKSLSKPYSRFYYVSYDLPCAAHVNKPKPKQERDVSYDNTDQKIMYIRKFPRRKLLCFSRPPKSIHDTISVPKAFFKREVAEKSTHHQHRGYCLAHRPNYINLENFNKVSEVRWWRSVSSSTSLISRPWRVYLNSADGGRQALALLLDIIAIGRLVLEHRMEYVKMRFQDEYVRKTIKRTSGVICNAILEETGLKEWGLIEKEMYKDDYPFPDERCKRYGLLFIVLTINSDLYGEKKYQSGDSSSPKLEGTGWRGNVGSKDVQEERVSAQTILENLIEFKGDRRGFRELERTEVDRWLQSWDCDLSSSP